MKFYIAVNGHHEGPFDLEQLNAHDITPSTLVWNETMTEWTPAGNVPYLVENLFNKQPRVTPPPIGQPPHQTSAEYAPGGYYGQQAVPPCPNSWHVPSILATILCCLPFGVIGIVYASKVNSLYFAGKYDEAVRNANIARNWTIASIISALIYAIFVGISLFVGIINLPYDIL